MQAATVRTQFAEANGRKIAYRTMGSGEPMILCQRFRGNLDDWDPAFLDELGRYYQVYIFDYSGMGSSTGEPNTDMMGFALDAIDLADTLQIDQFLLGGWSFGGWVAQIITTEFTSRVKQTILLGTKPPGAVNHSPEKIFLKTAYIENNSFDDEVILFFEPASEKSRALAKESHDRINSRTVDRDSKVRPDLWQYCGKGSTDFLADPYNARQKLQETTIPILVISGDHEICFPVQNWFELNRLLPTTQVVVIPQAGHGPHHQYPVMAVSYIHAFIESNKLR